MSWGLEVGQQDDVGRGGQGLLDLGKEFDFYSKSNGKKLEILTNLL